MEDRNALAGRRIRPCAGDARPRRGDLALEQGALSIYRWNGAAWDQVAGGAKDVGIGAERSVWVVGDDGTLLDEVQIKQSATSYLSCPVEHHRGAIGVDGVVTIYSTMPTVLALFAEGRLTWSCGVSLATVAESVRAGFKRLST